MREGKGIHKRQRKRERERERERAASVTAVSAGGESALVHSNW